jgi:antitoxin FitA
MHVSTLVQIRNVPEKTHAALKARAAAAGQSLNSYMLEIIEREIEEDSVAARRDAILRKHIDAPRRSIPNSAEMIRRDREAHEAADNARIERSIARDRG